MRTVLKSEQYWWRIFEFGILVKFLNGLWEIAAGISIFALGTTGVAHVFSAVDQWRFDVKPPHVLLQAGAQAVHSAPTFVGLYFLIHGIINIFLAVQLFRKQLWAYLATMAVTSLFIVYQIHRIFRFHSGFLTAITIYDVLFVILTWHEYNYQKRLHGHVLHE